MYRTAKSLELVEVEVYGCFILCPYLLLHKTLILCNVVYSFFIVYFYKFTTLPLSLYNILLKY